MIPFHEAPGIGFIQAVALLAFLIALAVLTIKLFLQGEAWAALCTGGLVKVLNGGLNDTLRELYTVSSPLNGRPLRQPMQCSHATRVRGNEQLIRLLRRLRR